ncbi:MAG: V-type ATPase 116kDa subunit family protein [Candidatus Thermoplasmatota archaeon]|nr:V-type ATPase 116kDa subunit family protein [Candidatus Thermoplasmatota archaeon]
MRADLDNTVDALQDNRIIQSMINSNRNDRRIDPRSIEAKTKVDKIIDLLAPMEKIDKGFLKQYLRKDGGTFDASISPAIIDECLKWLKAQGPKVDPLWKERSKLEEELNYLNELRSRMLLVSGLAMDLSKISAFQRVRVKVGTTRRYVELREIVERAGGDIRSSLIDKKEGLHAVRILYTSSNSKVIEESLRGRVFSEMNLDLPRISSFLEKWSGSSSSMERGPLGILKEIDPVEARIKKDLLELKERGSRVASEILNDARGWSEALEIEIEKGRMMGSLDRTVYTSLISGWVPEKRMDELGRMMRSSTRGSYHIASRSPTSSEIEDNRVPTKLSNGRLGSLFEPFTTTFAVPKYNEIDPSIFISIPFILFFGLMLGDAGYGLLIVIPSIFIFVKGKKSDLLRRMGALGILMGLATTLSGIWMGSFFGDLIPRLIMGDPEAKLYSLTVLGMDLPYDTLRDPMLLFKMSLWIGFFQLNFGFLLLGYDRMKKKDVWGFIKGSFSWMLIQAGAIVFLGGILFNWWELSGYLPAFGGVLFLAGSVLLAFEIGFMFMFNIEGLLGDWISYTRILALGLSTFGLAMAFNIVGEMLYEISWLLVPVVVVLLLALHVFNLLLQTLGAAVHSIRLQYVEFFGRFFEGGGELFEPFGVERTYTKSSYLNEGNGRGRP